MVGGKFSGEDGDNWMTGWLSDGYLLKWGSRRAREPPGKAGPDGLALALLGLGGGLAAGEAESVGGWAPCRRGAALEHGVGVAEGARHAGAAEGGGHRAGAGPKDCVLRGKMAGVGLGGSALNY